MNINLDLYKTFCSVAENKSISKSAEEMFVSQSAITQTIQKIEKILGEKLFNSYSNLEKGVLRIGGGNTLISTLLVDHLCNFSKDYPGIKISIQNGLTDNLVEKVSHGELDIVVLNTPYKGKKIKNIIITPIKESSYCLFASKTYLKEHPFKNIEELAKHKLILPRKVSNRYRIFEMAFDKYIPDIEASFEVGSSSIVKKLVLNDVGIGFCEIESITSIMDEIIIIKEIRFDEDTQAIATLKPEAQNKVTKEFIKKYLKCKLL